MRKHPDLIEEGLRFVDHQVKTERGPLDVLLVDSGNALVVVELKVVEDDDMLVQGIDYYDHVASNIHAFALAYKKSRVDPEQDVRLFLIAPSFSLLLLNRCKWLRLEKLLSLFTFKCVELKGKPKAIVPAFNEVPVPIPPERLITKERHFNYIADPALRRVAEKLLKEIEGLDKKNIETKPETYNIRVTAFGEELMYLWTTRRSFWVSAADEKGQWWSWKIESPKDKQLEEWRSMVKRNYEKFKG